MGDFEVGTQTPAPRPYSSSSSLSLKQPQIYECMPNAGEILFLPIGWWSSIEVPENSAAIEFAEPCSDDDGPGQDVTLSSR